MSNLRPDGTDEVRDLGGDGRGVAAMTYPVRCTYCAGIYDLGKVEVIARYTDCSMWKAPCCGTTVDDRGDTGWKSRKDYQHLPSSPLHRPVANPPRRGAR